MGLLLMMALSETLSLTPVAAGELVSDPNTLLLLHCNDNIEGTNGETPTLATGVIFEQGVYHSGAYFATNNQVFYPSSENIASDQGTLEFWIRPSWSGNDGQDHFVLKFGAAGGMLFGKDAANNLRSIFNRYGMGGYPEVGVGINIGDWQAEEWHHLAFTWDSSSVKLYIDGSLRAQNPVGFPLPVVSELLLQLGADADHGYLQAVVDELRISDLARSAEEIEASYLAGLSITGLSIDPDPIELLETWWKTPELTASTSNFGLMPIPVSAASWSSSASNIATVDEQGLITAVAAGTATVTAIVESVSDQVTVLVSAPVLPPTSETVDPYLATPADGHLYEMPVVILRFLPTSDGINVDSEVTNWISTLDDLKARIDTFDKRIKFILEEGSRFRAYGDPWAIPSLGYRVLEILTFYETLPPGFEVPWNPGWYRPDYNQILTRIGADQYVNDLGVKEFWLWGYHHDGIEPAESNMSSPTTGDISNSERYNDDLPIYDHTYVLYNYNFTRTQAEAVHNHGHQLEAILSHVNWLQDGNTDLFWKKFVGQDSEGNFVTGRCGWTHMPPNTTNHYDYLNPALVESDIEDWTPEGTGETTLVNVDTWGDLMFEWPDGETDFQQRIEAQWYLYWMQNMPGYFNTIPYQGSGMTNWWEFTAEWDRTINEGLGLYGAAQETADLSISMPGVPDQVVRGDKFTYFIVVENQGPEGAQRVAVIDDLPLGLKLLSVTPSQGDCSADKLDVRCELGNMTVGTAATVSIHVMVTRPKRIVNTATVDSVYPPDPDASNNVVSATTNVLRH
jgi:uncharacterized repeat protein (TIGR01451 family)